MKTKIQATIFSVVGLACLLLTGCVPHLTAEQCLSIDWFQMGVNDGIQAQTHDLNRDMQDCAKYNITINTAAYQRGYQQGLKQFCTFQKGLQLGSQGAANPHLCAGMAGADFDRGWRRGVAQFCNNQALAYTLGKQGAGMPPACLSPEFGEFALAFHDGHEVYAAQQDMQGQIDQLKSQIDDIAFHYHLQQSVGGYYEVTESSPPDARDMLRRVDHLQDERSRLQHELLAARASN